jgi:hypothetical protein
MIQSSRTNMAENSFQDRFELEDLRSEEFGPEVQAAKFEKPRLLIDNCNPDQTVARLRDILSGSDELFDRGGPVRLAFDQMHGSMVAQVLTADTVIRMTHEVSRPCVVKSNKDSCREQVHVSLPKWVAAMYLDWRGAWNLPPLNGIVTAPLLRERGAIYDTNGYDADLGMWCHSIPDLRGRIPEQPTKDGAQAALQRIRDAFKTFPFADAEMKHDPVTGMHAVDQTKPLGRDESAFLNALFTAVCRPSVLLAPGVLVRAAPLSGSGVGKGLLSRCMCKIAYGSEPYAVTAGGGSPEELDKRISAELMQASPVLLLDNLNRTKLKSDVLASALTERPSRVRLLGKSQGRLSDGTE